MKATDKEVLHRMCDKIKLSDVQKENIMKKISEEASGNKKSFNVRRFAAVAASVLVLAGTTVFAEAKFGIVDRFSNLYKAITREEVILDESEKAVIEDISLESGYEFEVEGGKVRIDTIMYDSSSIWLMYTGISNGDDIESAFLDKYGLGSGLAIIVNGKKYSGGGRTSYGDLDENEEGYQGYYIFDVSPSQYIDGERVNDFSLKQGDEIILTKHSYIDPNFNVSHSLDDISKIFGIFTLSKPVQSLSFTCENTEGMEILETITEIRVTPLSITVMGSKSLRKTFPEGIGYKYFERVGGTVALGSTGDPEADNSEFGYAISIVKKDGTVAPCDECRSAGSSTGYGYDYLYETRKLERPVDLKDIDYILVKGWGLEYKIPVNVE